MDQPNGGVRLTLDLAIGETSAIESSDKNKLQDIAQRVRDLNARLNDVKREQVFQRVGTFPSFLPSQGARYLQRRQGRGNEISCGSIVTNASPTYTGARGRVPRPVRVDQRARCALDPHPVGGAGYYLRVAAVTSAVVLHQAEAYIDGHMPLPRLHKKEGEIRME